MMKKNTTKSHATSACRPPREVPPGKRLIFRRFRTLPNGTVIDAHQCGKKAFPMLVDIDDAP